MPTISTFYGIRIYINLAGKEHNLPHIHAQYGEYQATFKIKEKELLAGKFPIRATKMVIEFIEKYENELLNMWEEEIYTKLEGLD